jgi:uncharacterized membrane protein
MAHPNRNIQWLDGELNRWAGQGIISNIQAEAIRRLYPPSPAARPWALIVFSGFGAGIIGLGVILLFAYNWHYIPKFGKLGIIFAAIAIAHGIGLWLFLRTERFRTLGEAITVLGTMLFGAGIWLVAQIYNISEHYPTAFLFWGLGALALAWAMPSVAQAIMAAVLFTIWAATESIEFARAMHFAIPAVILLWPLAYMKRSRVLLGVLILSFGFSASFVTSAYAEENLVIYVLLSVAALYVALGLLGRQYTKFPQAAPVFNTFGLAAYFVMLYLLTSPEVAHGLLSAGPGLKTETVVYGVLPLLVALAAWLPVVWPFLPWCAKPRPLHYHYEFLLIPLTLILFCGYVLLPTGIERWQMTVPCNLVFLAYAVTMMARGCRQAQLWPTILGSLMLVALTVARFTDLFESLVVRGLVFIVLGAILFCEGILYIRFKKKQVAMGTK